MLNVMMKSAAVEKLQALLKSRYGKVMKINWMKQVSSLDFIDGDHEIKNSDLHIPIQVHQHYFATAVVEKVNGMSKEDHMMISQLVKMVMEPEFYKWYLNQVTHNTQARIDQDNVVSIYNPESTMEADEDDEDNCQSSRLIFLQAENPNLIPRLANEVHEISNRWAFLRFKDIQGQVQSADDLKALGSLTLMVEDVLELSPEQQELVYQFLNSSNSEEHPLMVIGSGSKVENLESDDMIHQGLAQMLKTHRLEIDRLPRNTELLHEALEIMLES